MTVKHFAKTAAYAAGMFIFPIRPKQEVDVAAHVARIKSQMPEPKPEFDIDAHVAAVQASFMSAVKDDLK